MYIGEVPVILVRF